ncbi:MAG: hypothetical protein ACLFUU_11905 [Desulfobacteraceae bacterium]
MFIPKKLADRLKDYLKASGGASDQRIFPITYTAARVMVKKAGTLVGGSSQAPRPQAACGHLGLKIRVPVEIISKVIFQLSLA